MRTYTRKDATNCLIVWAHELAGGEGGSNLLARLHEAPGGGGGSRPPGGLFSPMAEKVDQSLKDIRAVDMRSWRLLIARSQGQTVEDMQREMRASDPGHQRNSRGAIYTDLMGSLDMLRTLLYVRRA